jgi:hypothetical protein
MRQIQGNEPTFMINMSLNYMFAEVTTIRPHRRAWRFSSLEVTWN